MTSLASQTEAVMRLDAETGLLRRSSVAILGSVGAEGIAHLAAVWFEFDGEAVNVATNSASRKARNLAARPWAELLVEDRDEGFGVWGAAFAGQAEALSEAAAEPVRERIFARYVSPGRRALPDVVDFLEFDDIVLRIAVERIRTWDSRETEAARAVAALDGVR